MCNLIDNLCIDLIIADLYVLMITNYEQSVKTKYLILFISSILIVLLSFIDIHLDGYNY